MRRIATLLGLIGLAGLVCLVAILTSSCSRMRPVTPYEMRNFYAGQTTQIEVVRAEVAAIKSDLVEFKTETRDNFKVANENFGVLAAGVEQATRRAEAAKNLGETTVKLLSPIGKNAATASKEATAGRKAAEAVGQKIADAQKTIGEKIDAAAATTGAEVADVGHKVDTAAADAATAHVALDQKVDTANATLGVVKTTAETAVSRASDARDEAVKATAAAELAKAEAAAAKAGADTVVEVGKVRKELSDHDADVGRALDAVKRHLGIP